MSRADEIAASVVQRMDYCVVSECADVLATDIAAALRDYAKEERERCAKTLDSGYYAARKANMAGDDLCWITDSEQAKALPEAEFLESCRRYRNQIASERGEFTGGRTIAQLEAALADGLAREKANGEFMRKQDDVIAKLRGEIRALEIRRP